MFLKSSRALLEPNMQGHVFKYEIVDVLTFLFLCETRLQTQCKLNLQP